MLATLEFKLPEEQHEFDKAVKGMDAHCVLQAMDNFLREKIKYAGDDVSTDMLAAYGIVRDRLHEECSDVNIDIWD